MLVAIAGEAALPLESCVRNLAVELSWWVTRSLGGEELSELAGAGEAEGAGPACPPISSPAWVHSPL